MTRRRRSLSTFSATAALVLTACGLGGNGKAIDRSPTVTTVGAPLAGTTTAAVSATSAAGDGTATTTAVTGWSVDTSTCPDPARAEQPIVGTVKIGSVMPQTGSPAAAFGPVQDGLGLYLDYANDNNLLPNYTLSADIRDDQYHAIQTPGVVGELIDSGVDIFDAIAGTPNNLAVRGTLNDECIPQLLALTGSRQWGEVAEYPWTTGASVPYDVEASVYAAKLDELKPGAKVALYSIDSEFGKAYVDTFKSLATQYGFEIIDEQTVEPGVTDPPVAQVGSIAAAMPDAIVAAPVGLQCPVLLKELENAKAQAAGWAPLVFLTNTCASTVFFGLAGSAAEGVYTSNNLLDASDPKNATIPGVKTFNDAYAAAGLTGDRGVTEAGWNVGEITLAILNAALKTGTLSRKSIIEAARNLTFTPSLARPPVMYKMNGADDPFAFQTLQVLQWSTASATFTDIGDPLTQFES